MKQTYCILLVFLLFSANFLQANDNCSIKLLKLLSNSTGHSDNVKFYDFKKTISNLIERELISEDFESTPFLSMSSNTMTKYFFKFDLHYWNWLSAPTKPSFDFEYIYWYNTQTYRDIFNYSYLFSEFASSSRPKQSRWRNKNRPVEDFWASFSRYLSHSLDGDNSSIKRKDIFLSYFLTLENKKKIEIMDNLKNGMQKLLDVMWKRFNIESTGLSKIDLDLNKRIFPQVKNRIGKIINKIESNSKKLNGNIERLEKRLRLDKHTDEFVFNLVQIVKGRVEESLKKTKADSKTKFQFYFKGMSKQAFEIIDEIEKTITSNHRLMNIYLSMETVESSSEFIDLLKRY